MIQLGLAAADLISRRLTARLRKPAPAIPEAAWRAATEPELPPGWGGGTTLRAVHAAHATYAGAAGGGGAGGSVRAPIARRRGRPGVELLEVVAVTYNRGAGIEGDPVRNVVAYFDRAGVLLAEHDDWEDRNGAG